MLSRRLLSPQNSSVPALLLGSDQTFLDGDLYFDIDADRERQAAIDDMKARLMPPDDDDAEESEEDTPAGESEPAPEVSWGDEETYSCRHEVIR